MNDNDKEMETLLNETADIYNTPPAVPRDRMWERIDTARAQTRGQNRSGGSISIFRHPGFVWPMAAAAVLLLGVAIGRFGLGDDSRGTAETPPVVAEAAGSENTVYGPLTSLVFGKAEALLTDVCSSGGIDDNDTRLPLWAGSLLIQTRLLMDTPAADDVDVKLLLEDLELVLAQIVQAAGSQRGGECEWIVGGMRQRATLTRLRTKNLAGKSARSI